MACEGPAVLLHQTAAFSCGAPTVSCSFRVGWLVDVISGKVGVADHIRQVVTTLPTQGGWVDARGWFTARIPCHKKQCYSGVMMVHTVRVPHGTMAPRCTKLARV